MPRVSVTIPVYNHEKYVAEAIQSVLDQTYQDFEIVITNDGSTDGTVDKIETFTDPRIKLFSFEKNRGFISADNNCIRNAAGEYIAELSSDDMFLPHKLEKQVKFLDEHPNIAAVFGYPHLIDEDGNDFTDVTSFYYRVYNQTNRTRHEWLNYFFYNANCLAHPSVLIRRKCLDDIGYGDERFVQLPDFDLWIRLCMKYAIHILPEKVFKFRIRQGGANLSGDRLETRIRDLWEHEQVLKHFLHIESVDEFCKIFPQIEKYRETCEDDLLPFSVAKLALEVDSLVHQRFAIGVLFDLMGNSETAGMLAKKYGFSYSDLIKITGQTDIYNYSIVDSQKKQLTELKELEDRQRHEIATLKELEDRQRHEIATLKELEDRQRHEIATLKELEDRQRHEIATLKELEDRQRHEIATLKELEDRQRHEIATLKELEDRQRHEIATLKELEDRQRHEIATLKELEDRQRHEIATLKELAHSQRNDISFLRAAGESQRVEIVRLKTIENSLSWRTIRKWLDIFDKLYGRKRV